MADYKFVNRYCRFSKISEAKFRLILRCFALDFTASDTARMSQVSVRSVNELFLKLRRRILILCPIPEQLHGTVELDESYFCPKRIRGKRGRGAGSKTIGFGLLKRGGYVYTEIIPDCSKSTIGAVLKGKLGVEAIINTDGWRGYDGLVDMASERHLRVHHGDNEFVRGSAHINGIESFWAFAKGRLAQFKGLPKHTFLLHLKETEFRFNNRDNDLYKSMLKLLKQNPL